MAIKIVSIECPKCHATLDLDSTREFCYCTYCGTKIYVDNDSVKTININYNYTKTDVAKIRKIEAEEHIREMEYARAERERKSKSMAKIAAPSLGVVLFVFSVIALAGLWFSEKKEQDRQIAYFEQLVVEVEQDIKDGDYVSARSKANKIRYTANYSSEEEKKWNKIRKNLLKEIDYAENGKTPLDELIDSIFD